MSAFILYLGMDVHKNSLTVAVFARAGQQPLHLEKRPDDLHPIRRFLDRLRSDGTELRARYEASSAGYVLQRHLAGWASAAT